MSKHLDRLILPLFLSAGCGANLAAASSGKIGCPESEIEISDDSRTSATRTWTAVCRGQTYYCSASRVSAYSADLACRQDTQEVQTAAKTPAAGDNRPLVRSFNPPYADPPGGAVGFQFEANLDDTQNICKTAQFAWSGAGDNYVCAGTPKAIGVPATTRIRFCAGKVCEINLLGRLTSDDSNGWLSHFARLSDSLKEKYGDPNTEERKLPADCRATIVECVKSGTASVRFQWIWSKERMISVALRRREGEPVIELVYRRLPRAEPAKIDSSAL